MNISFIIYGGRYLHIIFLLLFVLYIFNPSMKVALISNIRSIFAFVAISSLFSLGCPLLVQSPLLIENILEVLLHKPLYLYFSINKSMNTSAN